MGTPCVVLAWAAGTSFIAAIFGDVEPLLVATTTNWRTALGRARAYSRDHPTEGVFVARQRDPTWERAVYLAGVQIGMQGPSQHPLMRASRYRWFFDEWLIEEPVMLSIRAIKALSRQHYRSRWGGGIAVQRPAGVLLDDG